MFLSDKIQTVKNNYLKILPLIMAQLIPHSLEAKTKFYQGCLLFQDDVRTNDDLSMLISLKPNALIRSWYRFGEPVPEKKYSLRKNLINDLNKKNILLGGGSSLSIINARDLSQKKFSPNWLVVDLQGKPYSQNGEHFATLSAPGFRSYLIQKLLEQARTGVKELALGETNGKIFYDDWSLGIKGGNGFIQWIKQKYQSQNSEKWHNHLGKLGLLISQNKPVTREAFTTLQGKELANFQAEWGIPHSWHGTDENDQPAFLSYLYKQNLKAFLLELKSKLKADKLGHVTINIWGTADWLSELYAETDAVMDSPPDERWGLNWNTDPNFDLQKNRPRMKKIMQDQITSVAPAQMIYMFDHPMPFLNSFIKLTDERQSELTQFFSDLSQELGAKFVLRSYSEVAGGAGKKTKATIYDLCLRDKR